MTSAGLHIYHQVLAHMNSPRQICLENGLPRQLSYHEGRLKMTKDHQAQQDITTGSSPYSHRVRRFLWEKRRRRHRVRSLMCLGQIVTRLNPRNSAHRLLLLVKRIESCKNPLPVTPGLAVTHQKKPLSMDHPSASGPKPALKPAARTRGQAAI